jgi:hypothetical protein
MHQGPHLVTLAEVLDAIDGTGLEWRLLYLDATARIESGLPVGQLGRDVRAEPGGRVVSDSDLRVLAGKLDQVVDCDLYAFIGSSADDATTSAVVSVVAFDSGEWDLEVSGTAVGRLDLTSPILGARFP